MKRPRHSPEQVISELAVGDNPVGTDQSLEEDCGMAAD